MGFNPELDAYLNTKSLGRSVRYMESTPSTNDEAKLWARQGAPHGAVVLAAHQSAGRGRRGRAWITRPGEALLMSVILSFGEGDYCPPLLAPLTGLAVARALQGCGLAARLKWPNDVLLGGRKVCGILVESRGACAVVGIGINVNQDDFPPELGTIATSIKLETGREQDIALIAARVLDEMEDVYEGITGGGERELTEEYRALSATLGKDVRVTGHTGDYEARAVDISGDGSLIVELASGERVNVMAGDVSIRRICLCTEDV